MIFLTCLEKAKYSGDQEAENGWNKVENETLPEKLKWLEKLLVNEGSDYFCDSLTAADVAVFSVLNIAIRAGLENCLDNFPKLKKNYELISQIEIFLII